MEQGDDGGKRWGIIGIIGSCIVGLHKASVTTRAEGKQATPHLGGPSHQLLLAAGKRSWHSKGFSLQNIRSSQSFVLEVEVEGYLVGW